MKTARGFTAIELVMVVAIVGATAAMGTYAMQPSASNAPERANMFLALSQARDLASTRTECVVVRVQGQVMTTASYTPVGASCAGPFTATPTQTLPTVTFANDVQIPNFSNGTQTIVFDVTGGLAPDQMITFTLTNGRKQASNFKIYPAIGQIRAQ